MASGRRTACCINRPVRIPPAPYDCATCETHPHTPRHHKTRLHLFVASVCVAILVACAPRADRTPPARDYLYLWTASADTTQPDFLAVLDVTEDSGRYGRLVTTLPVPGVMNRPHHTEHELPANRQLFANGFGSRRTFLP